jgi:hypothetical protein
LGLKNVARTASGKVDHAKLSMKDRMAIVRGMRKRRRRGQLLTSTLSAKRSIRTPSPTSAPAAEAVSPETTASEASSSPDQYKGHVTEIERVEIQTPITLATSDISDLRPRLETDLLHCDQPQFLLNLDLFPPAVVDSILDSLKIEADAKLEYRNLTYIPEMTDKKHKISYNYLAPDINSPPLLRTRQRIRPQTAPASRMTSRSNSRATTPDRSITRQQSNASSEQMDPPPLPSLPPTTTSSLTSAEQQPKNEAGRAALESELFGLKQRSDELQSILNANKRTISTRVSFKKTKTFSKYLQF